MENKNLQEAMKKIPVETYIIDTIEKAFELFLRIERMIIIDKYIHVIGNKKSINQLTTDYLNNYYPDSIYVFKIQDLKNKEIHLIKLFKKEKFIIDHLIQLGFPEDLLENIYQMLFKNDEKLEIKSSSNPFIIRNSITQILIEFLIRLKIGKEFIDQCFKLKGDKNNEF